MLGPMFALLDLVLGDRAAALDDLEQMRRAHSNGTIYLAIEPPMAPLRNEPRFAAIVQAAEAGQR